MAQAPDDPPARGAAPQLGPQIKAIRKKRDLSLDDLARLSGVSKSMLSQIERGVANPTFATLWNLTSALGLDLPDLIGGPGAPQSAAIEVMASGFTPQIRSEDGLCTLKILSPTQSAGQVEWYQLVIEPGGALISEPHARGSMEHLTAWRGELEVGAGEQSVRLAEGATARYAGDLNHRISNPGREPAVALLMVLHKA